MQRFKLVGLITNATRTAVQGSVTTQHVTGNYVCFSTSKKFYASSGPHMTIKDAYTLLNLQEGCTGEELKDTYIRLAKHYHPDSGASTADARNHLNNEVEHEEVFDQEDDDIDFNIKHTAPQHRQYLSYEGVGMGTPNQRQKQYQQMKVMRATERVHDHRMKKVALDKESAMVVREKEKIRKMKVSNVIDRLVEDLIQESMHKGDFDNLPGKGRPLDYTERNPLVDTMTHNINKILINNGYAPEWITLEKDIRTGVRSVREKLAIERNRLGDPPLSSIEQKRWNHHSEKFRMSLSDINKQINKFNLIVPLFQKQMLPYNLDRECSRIFENYQKYLPPDLDERDKQFEDSPIMYEYYKQSGQQSNSIQWIEVWKNIKEIFKS
ncbi:hypothetical protein KUTeg_008830 [Tegillarca granosa]|uniref:J domain-containing protein n=1 Tax=Tegillarca granosa TaxID=220873 RepID=A0ABQ9FA95_TEGGR|nr:hypothetical protein KUTeg_008830 [Tegillarca granosa]